MTDGFSVSVPDLRGFAGQVSKLGACYTALEGALRDSYEIHGPGTPGLVGAEQDDLGPLYTAHQEFETEFLNLMGAEEEVCVRLGEGLSDDATTLNDVADAYERHDEENRDELPSLDENDRFYHQSEIDHESISGGEANQDWDIDLDIESYLNIERWHYEPMIYEADMEELKERLLDVDPLLPLKAYLGPIETIDDICEIIFGFSPTRELVRVFLIGDWRFLWYMRDICTAAAEAVTKLGETLRDSRDTLHSEEWSGAAAEQFGKYGKSWQIIINRHSDHLQDVSTLLGTMGDHLDSAGEAIATLLLKAADTVHSIATSGRNIVGILRTIAEYLVGVSIELFEERDDAIEGILAVNTKTTELVSAARAIRPPRARQVDE